MLILKRVRKYCECGCGGLTRKIGKHKFNRFITGHNRKGKKMSADHKRKIGLAHKGKIVSEETRKNMSYAHKGKKLSKETKRKISIAGKARILSEEHKRRIGLAHKGKTISEAHKRKVSEANRGRKHSEETKIKISESARGRIFSEERKKNISESLKGRTLSKEHVRKMSLGQLAIAPRLHKNGYCGDFDEELKDFVRSRDNYECVYCGFTQTSSIEKWNQKLIVHHIDEDKLNNVPENLETCCRSCHAREHHKRKKR